MPRAITKPIAKRRSPAAALKVSEPERSLTATPVAISHSGHGIAELAQELADLHSLCTRLADAQGPAEQACNEAADKDETHDEAHTACCKAVRDFEQVGHRANAMVNGLERLILTLEPRTPSETLSLALLLAEELGTFVSRNTSHEDRQTRLDCRHLEEALYAVIRGLVSCTGATSPLADAYSTKDTFSPWAERRSAATREAGLYSITYDPVQGRLRKVGAQP
jgi:hypothetical protein